VARVAQSSKSRIMTAGLRILGAVGGAEVCGPQQGLAGPHAAADHASMPIENPKGVAGLAKQKFADSYREFDSDPT
jgi:hypothetical protein